MNAIDEVLEEAVPIESGEMFNQRCDAKVVTLGVSGLAQGGPYLITVCHIDKVLIYGQGLGIRCKRGRVKRLKPQGGIPLTSCCSPL